MFIRVGYADEFITLPICGLVGNGTHLETTRDFRKSSGPEPESSISASLEVWRKYLYTIFLAAG
jgi:hypothetical protein